MHLLSALLTAVLASSVPNAVAERPKVEYVEVEGEPCLQPVVRGPELTRDDYRQAMARWLEAKYPGAPVPRWTTLLTLPPGSDGNSTCGVRFVSETAFIETGGRTVEVCFDVGWTEGKV